MAQRRFNWFDVIITAISLVTLLLDIGTDIIVSIQLFLEGHTVWSSLLLAFAVTPLLVMNGVSLKWHSTDGSLTCATVFPHLLLLAPVLRYLRVLWLGFKSCLTRHPRFTDAALREQNDSSILRLFETFLESAPQLTLQVLFMVLQTDHINMIHVLSASTSLVSLAWALTAYSETSRLNHQTAGPRRILAACVHCLWQLFMVSARVAALVLFASALYAWVCLFAGLHWLAMTIWIWMKGTDFGHGRMEQALFRVASGFTYIFVYLNVHEGPSRGRMATYYCLVFLENGVLFAVWLLYGGPALDMKIGAAIIIFGGFVLGGVCLMVYYRWLHPSGPHYLFAVKSTLPKVHHKVPQSPKERRQYQAGDASAHSPGLQGSTLELSIETETPAKGVNKSGDSSAPHTLDSSTREALECAWQSGLNCSDSSSSSSLDADDCSLEEFNTTVKSNTSTLKDKSQSSRSTNQSHSSSTTVHSRHADTTTTHPPASSDRSKTHHSTSVNRSSSSSRGKGHTAGQGQSQHKRSALEMDHVSESGEDNVRLERDSVSVSDVDSHGSKKSRKKLSRHRVSSSAAARDSHKPLLQHYHSSSRQADRVTSTSKVNRSGRKSSHNSSKLQSYEDVNRNDTHHSPNVSSSTSDGKDSHTDPPSGSLNARGTPSSPPHDDPQTPREMSRDASFTVSDREAMAPFPDLVESMSPEPLQQRLYSAGEDGFGERAGGESLWGISPNASNHSSSQSRDRVLSRPGSTSQLPRLVDSFDSGSDPLDASNPRPGKPERVRSRADVLKKSFAEEGCAGESPAFNEDNETSWSSMNVNENEWSGLNNLNALTPDESLCSFASSDREECEKGFTDEGAEGKREMLFREGERSAVSRASTPSLTRSHSTSSLYHDFTSAGVSPSPPPGLKGARFSRHHSWVNSPDPSHPCQQPADTPWRLEYLNLDPAPPVEHDVYSSRHDPREVIIEMLMDQLKVTSLRSRTPRTESARLSPLRLSHLLDSHPSLGPDVNVLDWPAFRHLFARDTTLMSSPDAHSRGGYRNDIDLMRKALDLIEMQRFPHRFSRGTPDSGSPEVYVSGQYRPPIVGEGRETPQRVPSLQTQGRQHSQSSLDPAMRVTSPLSASLPRHSPGFAVQQPQPLGHVGAEQGRRRSMPVGQREGLYRYFVDSDSPIHTPLWNTPQVTPAATPSHRHLLHRYLTHNHTESGGAASRVQSAEKRSLRRSRATEGERLVPARASREPAARHMEQLEVVTDVPDSGMHSDTLSAASRRQPLQSLDNSPSISPSSVTQQPSKAHPKPQLQSNPAAQRRQPHTRGAPSAHALGHQSPASSHPASPKLVSVRARSHSRGYRQAMERGGDGCSASQASSPQRTSGSRARSADRLR